MEDNQGIKIWTKEKCQEEALKYTSITSLKIGNYRITIGVSCGLFLLFRYISG